MAVVLSHANTLRDCEVLHLEVESKLLPNPRTAILLFLGSYAAIAIMRHATDSPIPILAGVLTTTILAVYLTKVALISILRRDLAGRRGGPIMSGPLIYPVVLAVFSPYLPTSVGCIHLCILTCAANN
ncbi:hypothetical protein, partial [Xanthomonas campestris]